MKNGRKNKMKIAVALWLFASVWIADIQAAFADNEINSSNAISAEMKRIVIELGYSQKIADDFVKMVFSWMDSDGKPAIWTWKTKLAESKINYNEKKLTLDAYSDMLAAIAKEINSTILNKIKGSSNPQFYLLSNVIKQHKAQCLGYSQTFYTIAKTIGLEVYALNVLECSDHYKDVNSSDGHVACLVRLAGERALIADLAYTSKPFVFEKEYAKKAGRWDLINAANPLRLHVSFQILDFNGILAYLHNNRGNSLYRKQEYQKAIADYCKSIELNPEFALAYNNRGVSYELTGEQSKAMSDYDKAIELEPDFFVTYYNRANLYGSMKENDKAIEDYTRTLSLNSRYADAYNNRGTVYYSTGKYDKAIEDYSKAVENNPSFTVAYCNLGLAYRVKGDYEKTAENCSKAIKIDPKYGFAYYNRGISYAALGKSGEAADDFLKALSIDPSLKEKIVEAAKKYGIGLD